MTVGNGFMKVEPDDGDTLAPPMISEETGSHFFSIAVFHQLHCLVSDGLHSPLPISHEHL